MNKRFSIPRLLMAAALALPALVMLAMILAYSVDVPFWDEWLTPGILYEKLADGQATLDDWVCQHNESRKIFPKLVFALVGLTAGWRVRIFMVIGWGFALLTGGLVAGLLQRTRGMSAAVKILLTGLVGLLLFSPSQYENQLWGIQLIVFIPALCLAACLRIRQSRLRPGTRALGCAALALAATGSYANGMMVWALGFPFGAWWLLGRWRTRSLRRSPEAFWSLIYLLAAALSIALYFRNYVKPAHHPEFSDAFHHPLQGVLYMLTWLGSPYMNAFSAPRLAVAAGGLVALMALAAVVFAGARMLRARNGAVLASAWPWLMWLAYGLASGLVTTLGRAGFGIEQASSPRYASFAIWVLIGAAGLLAAPFPRQLRTGRAPAVIWAGIALLLGYLLAIGSWRNGLPGFEAKRLEQLQNRLTVRLVRHAPGNPLFDTVCMGDIHERVLHLHQAGFFRFDLVGDWLPGKLRQPDGDGAGWFHLDRDSDGRRHVHGWAMLPPSRTPADFVLLCRPSGEDGLAVLTGLLVHLERPDVVQALGSNPLLRSGFSRRLDDSPATPEAAYVMFAVDERQQRVYRLEGP